MAANYLVNVSKLKGRDNYDDWTFGVKNYLILEEIDMGKSSTLTK